MRCASVLLPALLSTCSALFTSHDPELKMRAPEIIAHWGYPVEVHSVTTQDDYILVLHRIPHGRNEHAGGDRPVVFLMHALLACSTMFIVNLPHLSLGYILADAGFDVWMGNVRGNVYSKTQDHIDTKSHQYWQFTMEQHASIDLTAMIDYVLAQTKQESLYYVGHSQGSFIMFNHLSQKPEYAKKIRRFFALGPLIDPRHMKGLVPLFVNHISNQYLDMAGLIGGEILTDDKLFQNGKLFCRLPFMQARCNWFIGMIVGPSIQTNLTRLPVYLLDEPSGTSLRNLALWFKMIRGIQDPDRMVPQIDLSKIATPLHIFYGDTDYLAAPEDVRILASQINPQYLAEAVYLRNFSHLDFVWGDWAAERIYKSIVNTIHSDSRA